ncbi:MULTISPECIES: cell division ATP-binding protein FtsE [Microbacterium]|uniref:Cell division ATP-binding protein FtsE n=1 Tax=Microbacterium wangchenii TaxID=2541726 RepID=A0ABX5SSP6_9MICO|nr:MULTISPECIES: cell division ATP-binding protein FtsE [Microbacterium]MCK6067947.1 cell division ATP-binding protein FtsE [Microbacterium sp. EYE_512]QBR89171.1 cell division ATP-binding protein FtsE [Microbacterium wangchenii]TXK10840.1 cell division ATP-binding protein FtsE [Microbacterium wangchenii]
MIRFENVSKKYRGTSKPALDSVDFEVQRGEFVFLVGASGSGKSSCLRLILREETPSSGRVVVLGRDLRTLSNRKVPYFRRHVGAVFQDFRLLPTKTVFQNVAFTLQVTGASRGFIQQAVPEVLNLVGLSGKEKRLPHELSGGEQQRVAIARALVNRPQVLLADEPTGNLDPGTSIDIMQLLARINAGGTTVVMATHEAAFVDQMQRRVIELQNGQMMRDERHGGYGDTSGLPRLTPEVEKGAAAVAALTAVLEVQREVAQVAPAAGAALDAAADELAPAVADALGPVAAPEGAVTHETSYEFGRTEEPASVWPPAPEAPRATAAPQVRPAESAPETQREAAPVAAASAPVMTEQAPAPGDEAVSTHTRPVAVDLPQVDIDELGLADRLGLDDRKDEVGPTS